jgi:cytoskeleton protein RodZ
MIDSQLEIEAGAVMSAGMQLRALRHSKSMDVAVLAGILKVPPQRIRDLEADRFDLLPDLSFVRALATSICRVLKVDAAPVLAALPKGNVQVALEELQAVAEQRATLRDAGPSSRAERQRRTLLILAIVILALAGAIWAWADGRMGQPANVSSVSSAPATGAPEQVSSPSGAAPEAATASDRSMDATVATASAVTADPAAKSVPASPSTATSAEAAAPTQAAAVAAPKASATSSDASPDGRAQVTLSTTEPSWIEVRSSSSTVVYAGTLTAGQSMSLSVVEPASLIVGNARATRLLWRGQSVDLSPFTRDNVARLTWPQQP